MGLGFTYKGLWCTHTVRDFHARGGMARETKIERKRMRERDRETERQREQTREENERERSNAEGNEGRRRMREGWKEKE